MDLLKSSRPYLEYLLDRSAAVHDLNNDEGRRKFLTAMLPVAARIPTEIGREQFGERLAQKARITQEAIRAEVRKAAVQKRPELTARELPSFGQVKQAEKGLIWALIHDPQQGLAALNILQDNDLEGLPTRRILEEARTLTNISSSMMPSALFERLNQVEADLVTSIAAHPSPPASPMSCARELQQLRVEREFGAIQHEIARLQDSGEMPDAHLLAKKLDLARELELLSRTVH
jgi:DNA primase